jgi:phage FluMu gp28-like protein
LFDPRANPATEDARQNQIELFVRNSFPSLFSSFSKAKLRLGFDVAASGQGDLAAIYIDEFKDSALWLRALFTVRTEDWHFLITVLFYFLDEFRSLHGAGDESGLGRQIYWQAASKFGRRFLKVNFASKKQDLGFALMNQLSVAEKRFPRSQQDVAADFFAVRKFYSGTRWIFTEGRNTYNPASHCDLAWAGALATHAHNEPEFSAGGMVG